MSEAITKPTSVELYLKARGATRVKSEAKDAFVVQLDKLADRVARGAIQAMQAAGEKTVLPEHVTAGFRLISGQGPGNPAALFAAMEKLGNDDLAEFLRLIQDWLASPPTS